MRWSSILLLLAMGCSLAAAPSAVGAEPQVELELVTEEGFPLTGGQKWIAALKGLRVSSLRIRQAKPGDRAELVRGGTDASPVYYVKGLLTRQNTLLLPGGRFTLRDRARIAGWIAKVKAGGPEELSARPSAFGLSAKELVKLHEQLAARVSFSTKGERPKAMVRKIADLIEPRVAVDQQIQRAFAGDDIVAEELSGVASGTALAAIVRPLGLVLVARKQAGQVRLVITDFRKAQESWPIGWPPEKKARELLPKFYEFLTVEIKDTVLSDVLTEIQGRLEVPFLLDHNSLARHRIDPSAIRVNLPEGRTYYKKIVDRILFQAKLKAEIRVDEAGQPLLWISTVKR